MVAELARNPDLMSLMGRVKWDAAGIRSRALETRKVAIACQYIDLRQMHSYLNKMRRVNAKEGKASGPSAYRYRLARATRMLPLNLRLRHLHNFLNVTRPSPWRTQPPNT